MKKVSFNGVLTIILAGWLAGWLAGCASTNYKEMAAIGGSKADGIVELSYTYLADEKYVTSDMQGLMVAQRRCQAWGHKDAEKFSGGVRECIRKGLFSCQEYQVTYKYQCVH